MNFDAARWRSRRVGSIRGCAFLDLFACAFLTACLPVSDSVVARDGRTHFKEHAIATACGRTFGCRIEYAGIYQRDESDSILLPPLRRDVLSNDRGLHIGIDNFPAAAIVSWKSSDGVGHEAAIDIGSIFKNQRFLHRALDEEIFRIHRMPVLILVVDDRTIRVYMRTTLVLNREQVPSDRLSMVREDVVLAFSKEY
jgi:hypothetical protein